ncbi:hypothetical protein GDO78_005757 [Eleutherodactylus coqui]|uniref:Uncharacterized protein n=1 Tax=Eleutherodactylus coqui TaxID=57060 RepID=A0A8J6FN90_ELECQ|nr:hypothetical protein GDO78_005757 [Eleutherodactylus coqui]
MGETAYQNIRCRIKKRKKKSFLGFFKDPAVIEYAVKTISTKVDQYYVHFIVIKKRRQTSSPCHVLWLKGLCTADVWQTLSSYCWEWISNFIT